MAAGVFLQRQQIDKQPLSVVAALSGQEFMSDPRSKDFEAIVQIRSGAPRSRRIFIKHSDPMRLLQCPHSLIEVH